MNPQDADAIIYEEQLSDAVSSTEDHESPEQPETSEQPADPVEPTNDPQEPVDGEEQPETPVEPTEPVVEEPKAPASDDRSPTETIAEAKTLIENLNLTEDKVFNDDGSVKPWRDVVPAGPYLASQLEPVTVTDKDGKTHEFMLLSDVEKAFPDGFEAKNNIEQMKFERQIMANETKFDAAVKTYQDAETRYTQEMTDLTTTRGEQTRIANEYKAMAEAGLVPKVGDPSDPKFADSEAVKELNTILEWMDKTNAENKQKGLGEITSLYVAKQLMGIDSKKTETEDKKNQIINERQEVASLSSSPAPETGKRPVARDIPMSRLADEIIASEGLR